MAKTISLLGSTGSIGVQSLDVIKAQGYRVAALAAGSNAELLARQVEEFKPAYVGVANGQAAQQLRARLAGLSAPPVVLEGPKAACQIAGMGNADIVLNAIVGIAGLSSTLAAAKARCDIALANKESLVTGGQLVINAVQKAGVRLLPVDSEHSAIFQCLQDAHSAKVLQKIILTASGGPFYGKTRAQLAAVTKHDALRHPNWSMGAKITIDSASLMNKGLELIEAMWLFNTPAKGIEIVVQRESIIHSMVEFSDNSVLAQLGVPDMRIPIQYALTWPERTAGPAPRLHFDKLAGLTFGRADEQTFRCLPACRAAAQKGGLAACAANGANEEAVALFLQDKISFLQIGELVEGIVNRDSYAGGYTLEDVYECDKMARCYVREKAL
ncbi:MAG: 1-deoxy-D-xylulose-5-phosphate reductoisomerase [Oscillospiraceae bacterium]